MTRITKSRRLYQTRPTVAAKNEPTQETLHCHHHRVCLRQQVAK